MQRFDFDADYSVDCILISSHLAFGLISSFITGMIRAIQWCTCYSTLADLGQGAVALYSNAVCTKKIGPLSCALLQFRHP